MKGKDGVDKGPLKEVSYVMAGQVIATQSPEEINNGKVTVDGQSYFVDGDKSIEDVLANQDDKQIFEVYGTKEEGDAAKGGDKSVKP